MRPTWTASISLGSVSERTSSRVWQVASDETLDKSPHPLTTPTPHPHPRIHQAVLEETSLERRLRRVLELVREQTRVLSIASKIHSEVEGKLNSRHREYYLRQQLKAIRSELGEEVRLLEEVSMRSREIDRRDAFRVDEAS